jgi:hypothetical protein
MKSAEIHKDLGEEIISKLKELNKIIEDLKKEHNDGRDE